MRGDVRQHIVRRTPALLFMGALLALVALAGGCGPSTSCLAAGTRVATPTGDVLIERLEVGDRIFSVDPRTGARVPTRITAIRTARRVCLEVITASGRRVVATADHPFFCPRTGRYVPLGELLQGKRPALRLAGATGKAGCDHVVAHGPASGTRTVYDLTVSHRLHNFEAAGFLVHNKSQGFTSTPIADLVAVSSEADGTPATTADPAFVPTTPDPGAVNPADYGTVLSKGTFVGGSGVVTVARPLQFDQILIRVSDVSTSAFALINPLGSLLLTLPAPTDTVDLRVAFGADITSVVLEITPVSSGEASPFGAPTISLPMDG